MDALELQSLLSSLFDFVEATIRHVVDKVDELEKADTNSGSCADRSLITCW